MSETEAQEQLFNPDDVYKMPFIDGVKLSPAAIVKAVVPYLSKDENRLALHFIIIGDKFIQATDGKRFIRLERDKLLVPIPNGAYRPVKDGKDYLLIALPHTLDLPFPNFDALLPASWDHAFEKKGFAASGLADIGELLYKLAQLKVCISHQFAEDIPSGDYQVLVGHPLQVVVFVGDYTVGIMPLRVKEKS